MPYKNHEDTLERAREYRIENRERISIKRKEFRLNNREKLRQQYLESRARNIEKIRERDRERGKKRREMPTKEDKERARLSYKKYHMTIKGKFSEYKFSSKRRSLKFELTFAQFKKWRSGPCFHCGATEKIGLDRWDNDEGYHDWNVVACCADCNYTRRSRTVTQFYQYCQRIVKEKEECHDYPVCQRVVKHLEKSCPE